MNDSDATIETPWTIASIETPAALVDMERVRANLRQVIDYCRPHRIGWRPHVKTHKSVEFARMQLEAGAVGLTVATPREAEVMSAVSDDLLLAHPPVGPKVERVLRLPERVRLTVALDSVEVLDSLARSAAARERSVGVVVEVDVGMGRIGLPDPDDVVALARRIIELGDNLERPPVRWRGILFYPGHIRVPSVDQDALLAGVRARLGAVLDALRGAGLDPEIVSGGSTPSLFRSHELPGLTEIRPGTAIFHDRDSVALGVTGLDRVAYTILATVVSTGVSGQAVVDAGSKALAKESFRAAGGEDGFGILLDRPDIVVRSVSEEHGILDLSGTDWRPRVGERVRIVPNHVCVSVNLQDRFHAFDGGTTPSGLRAIPIEGRGRLPVGDAA